MVPTSAGRRLPLPGVACREGSAGRRRRRPALPSRHATPGSGSRRPAEVGTIDPHNRTNVVNRMGGSRFARLRHDGGPPALNDERHSSMGSYPHLLSPGHYGSLELPNRIVMPAMRTRLAHQDGTPGSRDAAFFVARIRGGVGLVTLGSLLVGTEFEPAQPCTARIDTDAFVPSMQYLTNAVHDAGGRIAAQLTVGAGRARALPPGRPAPVSASDNSWVANPVVTCRALTTEDIGLLVRRFRDAAARVAEGGFDAIDIAARVGHLVDQFLSPVWNRRTDAYGGSLENRTRLAVDLVAAAKAGAPGLPVSVRLSVAHHVPGGRGVADSIEIARVLQAAGVDLIITDDGAAEAMHWAVPPMYLGEAPSLAAATALRRALTVPVMATGSINPEVAEKALADGEIDLVGMGRALIADPDLPRKLAADTPGRVRPCARCNVCMGMVGFGMSVGCAVNPQAGFETLRTVQRAHRAKRVVVVGGGPAGLEAARVAALRGHSVDLDEKADHLGGVIARAATSQYKKNLRAMTPPRWSAFSYRSTECPRNAATLAASNPARPLHRPERLETGLRVDRAAHRHAEAHHAHAGVAPGARAHAPGGVRRQLAGQVRVGDQGAAHAHQVDLAVGERLLGDLGGDRAGRHHRDGQRAAQRGGGGERRGRTEVHRWDGPVHGLGRAVVGDDQIDPGCLQHPRDLDGVGDVASAGDMVRHAQSHAHRQAGCARLHGRDQVDGQPGPVLQRAAVGVGAPVPDR